MTRLHKIIGLCCLLSTPATQAGNIEISDNDYITRQLALSCIQSSKEMASERQQLRISEAEKVHLASKISYLQNEVTKRRKLIKSLDRQPVRQNNDNYNKLVIQFESLLEEHQQTIQLFEEKQHLFISQHKQFGEIEYHHNQHCLQKKQISQNLYREVCQNEKNSWCASFYF
ncbi:hypothetical protein MNBD_GAMMA10-1247 [hydrothermal vent metagenome]|uniref:Uncharacterized protein n=1 Tax=hydrothermal vent metagenome TaxID=652676 RepID=A0A3B0YDQ9_9ZZZZ